LSKIQSFYILHLSSSRVIRSNYNIDVTISQARKNGELVAVAENQAVRTLFDLQHRDYDPLEIAGLLVEKRKLKGRKSTSKNIERIVEIENRLNQILFVPEIISLSVEDRKHYKKIINNSFVANGAGTPLFFVAQMLRRN